MKERSLGNLSLYWICQLLGWGSAAVYWSYYHISDAYPVWMGIASIVASFITGIGSTHLYKGLAHRHGWVAMNLGQLVPRLFLALLVLTAIYVFVAAAFVIFLPPQGMSFGSFLGMFTGGLRYLSIWLLAFHLYHYARNSRQAEIDQSRYEKLAIAAQFKRLNAELNPHFLFNSLNSVKALILENPHAAREAIDLLSDLLRSSLQYSDGQMIPLEEELQRISSYLALEKIRFEERLQYEMDIADASLHLHILPLSLYNLVENAIKHGINKSKSGGKILIRSQIADGTLHLSVINDGQLSSPISDGIGLQNISKRLALVYGSTASLDLQAISPQQVASHLTLPII
ncbi:MAG: histidine kinase [Bacteroidota bacterium]